MQRADRETLRGLIEGKRVALVGSGPGAALNPPGFVDSHDLVIRVNNYVTGDGEGRRCDVHYSFFGRSIKKRASELRADGVRLCWAKCPDSQPIESEWHRRHGKLNGIDFRYIFRERLGWWPAPVYVPTDSEFLDKFQLLGGRVPTSGFAALLDVLDFKPANVFLTGFDFFQSHLHNGSERWKANNPDDPIGHVPQVEKAWLRDRIEHLPVTMDSTLANALVTAPIDPPALMPRRERLKLARLAQQKALRRRQKALVIHHKNQRERRAPRLETAEPNP